MMPCECECCQGHMESRRSREEWISTLETLLQDMQVPVCLGDCRDPKGGICYGESVKVDEDGCCSACGGDVIITNTAGVTPLEFFVLSLAREKEWTTALTADSGKQIKQLDAIASALGIKNRTDATDLVWPIEILKARASSPAEVCATNRAEGDGGCGACSWCCAQQKALADLYHARITRVLDDGDLQSLHKDMLP